MSPFKTDKLNSSTVYFPFLVEPSSVQRGLLSVLHSCYPPPHPYLGQNNLHVCPHWVASQSWDGLGIISRRLHPCLHSPYSHWFLDLQKTCALLISHFGVERTDETLWYFNFSTVSFYSSVVIISNALYVLFLLAYGIVMSEGTWRNLDSSFLWSPSSTIHKVILKKLEILDNITEFLVGENRTQAIV